MTRAFRIVSIILLCAALFLGVAGEVYNRLEAFSGEICVALGRTERAVVRPAIAPRFTWAPTPAALQRDLPLDAIPFEDPQTSPKLLDASKTYDVMPLPFSLRLKNVQVLSHTEPRNLLKVTGPDGEKTLDATAGADLEVDGARYRVESIRKWSGILRERSGSPLAGVSVCRAGGPWIEDVFLPSEVWQLLEPNVAIRFSWFKSEAAARAALALPGIESARWGVVHGSAVDWFESFAPGTGAQLAESATVTLLRLDEHHATDAGVQPAIEVEIAANGERRSTWISANVHDAAAPIQFEYYARCETVILLDAFQDGGALAAAYRKQNACGSTQLTAGQSWAPEGIDWEIRLDNALETGVMVRADESPLYGAVLAGPAGAVRLRQGEAVRCGDVLLEFTRTDSVKRVSYEFVVAGAAAKEQTFSVGPDGSVRRGDWRLAQEAPARDPLRMAVLRAEYAPSHSWSRIVIAVSLAGLIWLGLQSRPRMD